MDSEEFHGFKSDLSSEESVVLDDSPDGIIIESKNDKSLIKGGRLVKLVEKLCTHLYPDNEYRNAFLLTHHSFTTSVDLMDLLIKRYDISPPYGLNQQLFEIYVNRKVVPIRLRVFNVLKIWTVKYPEDFIKSRVLTEKCLAFVESKMKVDFGEITVQLIETLKQHVCHYYLVIVFRWMGSYRYMPKKRI